MKSLKAKFLVFLLLGLSLLFVGCNLSNHATNKIGKVKNAYITVDINPSIEIMTDEEGLVKEVNGLNDDGIKLLLDENFVGKTIDETLEEILTIAINLGYLEFDLENAVLITTSLDQVEEAEQLELKISEKVKEYIEARKMHIEVLRASLDATPGIKEIAEEYNISIGKVKLITRALAMDPNLSIEIAAKMSVRDLNKIIREGNKEIKEFYSEEIRDEYKKAKQLLEIEFELQVLGLFNNYIQNSSNEVFIDILKDSNLSLEEFKAIYLEYYNAMLAVELSEVEEPEETVNEIDKAENYELKEKIEKIQTKVNELSEKIKGKNKKDLPKSEIKLIREELKDLLKELRELNFELNRKVRLEKVEWLKENLEKRRKENVLKDLYKEVEKYYEELFEEHNIDLDELNEMLKEILETEIANFKQTYLEKLNDIREQFIIDSKALKDQLLEERNILREIWNR